jgi:hypothetical protein
MRENRTYGSEGGEAKAFPTPTSSLCEAVRACVTVYAPNIGGGRRATQFVALS